MTRLVFLAKIEEMHELFKFSETSGWRTEKHNKAVGGVENSKHLLGLAVDCVLDNPADEKAFCDIAKAKGLAFNPEGDHIHLQSPISTTVPQT